LTYNGPSDPEAVHQFVAPIHYLGNNELMVQYGGSTHQNSRKGIAVYNIATGNQVWYEEFGLPQSTSVLKQDINDDGEFEYIGHFLFGNTYFRQAFNQDGHLIWSNIINPPDNVQIISDLKYASIDNVSDKRIIEVTNNFPNGPGDYQTNSIIKILDPRTGQLERTREVDSNVSNTSILDINNDGENEVLLISYNHLFGPSYLLDNNLQIIQIIPINGRIVSIADIDGDMNKELISNTAGRTTGPNTSIDPIWSIFDLGTLTIDVVDFAWTFNNGNSLMHLAPSDLNRDGDGEFIGLTATSVTKYSQP
jgi:hypothetical protein